MLWMQVWTTPALFIEAIRWLNAIGPICIFMSGIIFCLLMQGYIILIFLSPKPEDNFYDNHKRQNGEIKDTIMKKFYDDMTKNAHEKLIEIQENEIDKEEINPET